jgi:hypothetical protein
MKVRYTCHICALEDVVCEVQERAKGQDLEKWIQYLAAALRDDHHERSPECKAEGLSDVKIPTTGAEHIGGPTVE